MWKLRPLLWPKDDVDPGSHGQYSSKLVLGGIVSVMGAEAALVLAELRFPYSSHTILESAAGSSGEVPYQTSSNIIGFPVTAALGRNNSLQRARIHIHY